MVDWSCWKSSSFGSKGTLWWKILLPYAKCAKQSNVKEQYFPHYALFLAFPDYLIQSKQGTEPEGNGNSCWCSMTFDEYVSMLWKKLIKWILVTTVTEAVSPPFSQWRRTSKDFCLKNCKSYKPLFRWKQILKFWQ